MPFVDRDHAGQQLAGGVACLALVDPVVLALPRGGVPVGSRVAEELDAPLDVIVVRKLGVPFQPELAMGAIGEDGIRVVDPEVVAACGVSEREIRSAELRERVELEARARRFRSDHDRIPLTGRTAVVVDDGMATGSTARAACLVARAHGATRVVVAVPVASDHAVDRVRDVADDRVVLERPEPFYAVGQWYLHFEQTSDQDVIDCLARAGRRPRSGREPTGPRRLSSPSPGAVDREAGTSTT